MLAYVRSTVDYELHYPVGVPVDEDPDLARRRPRTKGTIEVLVDASFSPGDGHSTSGTVVLLAGCPVQWESRKQTLMALSTAEAELTALVEGLQTGRSVRALVELLSEEVSLELFNDNRAAVVLASGAGGGWRTRHLRIRAFCLSEALSKGELTLEHRSGAWLWADALTKSLPAPSLERFCRGVFLCQKEKKEEVEPHILPGEEKVKVSKCMVMMLAGASLLPRGSASEVCEKGETTASLGSCLLHMVKEFGLGPVQRFIAGSECLKRPAAAASSPMKSKPIPYVRFGGAKRWTQRVP